MTTPEIPLPSTKEIADRLHELYQIQEFSQAWDELFSPNAKSLEPPYLGLKAANGKKAVEAQRSASKKNFEKIHSETYYPAIIVGPYIFIEMVLSITMKETGRQTIRKMIKYTIEAGKISSEEFFY